MAVLASPARPRDGFLPAPFQCGEAVDVGVWEWDRRPCRSAMSLLPIGLTGTFKITDSNHSPMSSLAAYPHPNAPPTWYRGVFAFWLFLGN